ncbi:MAG: DUF1501 domain-containing protein [Planctomycetes bacterium]|nr:DUF1501 domain-containing protein [Planctomycetota bacterium]
MSSNLHRPSRRGLLRAGVASTFGFGELARAATRWDDAAPARTQAVIQIFLPGGLAHQETFDPKPYSPLAYRGDVKAIPTALDGVRFGSYCKETAKVADRLCVVRSFTHGEAAHERGVHNMMTGFRPSPAVVYPSMGSVVSHELGGQRDLPAYVCVPRPPSVYAGPGYLSSSFAPFGLGGDPASRSFKVRDLDLPDGVDGDRFARRRAMLEDVNGSFLDSVDADEVGAMGDFYERAYALLESESAKSAFRLNEEPKKLRDRYGRGGAGQRLLMARRLVENGVRYVTVSLGSWDMHQRISRGMSQQFPAVDRAFATLIADLDDRGLLDTTLVLLTTEFGRTPRLNPTGGRDHWPRVFSVVMAGGGVKRGHVHGRSDATASEVEEKAVGPEDLARTVYTLMGVDPDRTLLAGGNRPLQLVKGGRVMREVLA